jgi:alpha-galactosidase
MRIILSFFIVCLLASCKEEIVVRHGNIEVAFNELLHSRITSHNTGSKTLMEYSASEHIITESFTASDFKVTSATSSELLDSIGTGKQWIIKGEFNEGTNSIEKILRINAYDSFPDQLFYKVCYVNKSPQAIKVSTWVNHHYEILSQGDSIPFWSFQGESTGARKDWVQPLKAGFAQRNFMGMNNTDYGGGIPITDVWREDQGIAIGHTELVPRQVSLPVKVTSGNNADIQIRFDNEIQFNRGDTITTYETLVSVHGGDHFTTMKRFGEVLSAKGIDFASANEEAFEASWCAWGYMRNFTIEEIRGTIPKVKELGIKWVTIDDGYQQAEGDWNVVKEKFPRGDRQMRELVDELHSEGLKIMLWWTPLAADPGSKILSRSPELKSLTEDGAPHFITWWDAYYLSPVYPKTIDYTKETLSLFFEQYNVDGLKMDGQHLNAVAPDHNPQHELEYAEQSPEGLPGFFKMIYEESNRLKPGAVIQNCPCGTCMSVYNMPYMNQAVASDPLNSWQVRLKGKTYKGLIPQTAYFGDHVELSDERTDFASSFGVGAVPGTKFTWPKENPKVTEQNLLTPEKELQWKKWFSLYREKMLSKEHYRGELYDIGYDIPETHVIQKGDTLHYAFYQQSWSGQIELRGLVANRNKVRDYVNGIDLGEVTKKNPVMSFSFTKNLLIEVYPIAESSIPINNK